MKWMLTEAHREREKKIQMLNGVNFCQYAIDPDTNTHTLWTNGCKGEEWEPNELMKQRVSENRSKYVSVGESTHFVTVAISHNGTVI